MRAVLLIGGFSTTMRPITLSLPLPLLEFCNKTLLMVCTNPLRFPHKSTQRTRARARTHTHTVASQRPDGWLLTPHERSTS